MSIRSRFVHHSSFIIHHSALISMQSLKNFSTQHPKIVAWIALSIGMVVILLWSAKDVGLLFTQTLALVIATIVLAGLCVWIIGWEDGEDENNAQNPPAAK